MTGRLFFEGSEDISEIDIVKEDAVEEAKVVTIIGFNDIYYT
jgi:hypothetical protein